MPPSLADGLRTSPVRSGALKDPPPGQFNQSVDPLCARGGGNMLEPPQPKRKQWHTMADPPQGTGESSGIIRNHPESSGIPKLRTQLA